MAEANTMSIKATWVEGLQFIALGEESGSAVPIDAVHGDGSPCQGASPMELVLMGLAGCTGMDVITILQKKRQRVTHMYIHVKGYRNEDHPKSYHKIETEFIVRGYHVDPQAVERAIWLSQTKYCAVINSLKAEVVSSFRVEQEEELPAG